MLRNKRNIRGNVQGRTTQIILVVRPCLRMLCNYKKRSAKNILHDLLFKREDAYDH